MVEMKTFTFLLGIIGFLLDPTVGHTQNYNYRDNTLLKDAKTDMYTIGGSGLAGAVMGLSTLSFAENPGHRLKNIVTGGALGIVVGVVIVAYSQANKSQNLLGESPNGARPSLLSHITPRPPLRSGSNGIAFHFQF